MAEGARGLARPLAALLLIGAVASPVGGAATSVAARGARGWGAGLQVPAMAGRAGSLALRGGAAKKKSHFLSKKEKELLETLSKGEVLSAEEPGELAGKEDTHVPVATATEKTVGIEKGVRIEVKHVMNDEDEKTGQEIHYIEFVWMMDSETGAALGYKRLTPGKNQEASPHNP
ncbi:hypothetical protein T484DRAFT_1813888 [Baffinella frigidus]|nr:hypothetical protein T484DRAFT_1813888 [Cryptophyta sp. CCMP2293]